MWQALLGAGIDATNNALIAGLNYYNQYEQQQWERSTLERSWNREDSAIQRRVRDLQASGLSPVLAAGQGASTSGPIRSTPPQIEMNPLNMAMNTLAMQQAEAGIARTKAETDNIKLQRGKIQAETNAINLATDINATQRDTKFDLLQTELQFKKALNPENLRRANLENQRLGISNTTALVERKLKEVGLDTAIINRSIKKIEESIASNYSAPKAQTELLSKQALLQLLQNQNQMSQMELEAAKKLGLTWWGGGKKILETLGEGADIITKFLPGGKK